MPSRPDIAAADEAEALDRAISEAAAAGARFSEAKSQLEHQLAAVDDAVLGIMERVFDAMPPEYQRTVHVRRDGRNEELPLPDFVRLVMEAPGGTQGTFRIEVAEDLYAAPDDDDEEEDEEDPGVGGIVADDEDEG